MDEILKYSKKTEERITGVLGSGNTLPVIGGDCSLLPGIWLALKKRGSYGLVHINGHTDFSHPGNSSKFSSLSDEDLTSVV